MMLYPDEHFWTVPTIPGLYDDNDYSGKIPDEMSYVNEFTEDVRKRSQSASAPKSRAEQEKMY